MANFLTNDEQRILGDITAGHNTYDVLCARHRGVLHERRIDRILQRLRKLKLTRFDRPSRMWRLVDAD